MKIGMLTSGGDCQGLNAALRGVAKALYQEFGTAVTIYGIRDGYRGLIEGDYHPMEPQDFSDILTRGGTILGTSRQPFKTMQQAEENEATKLEKMLDTCRRARFDCLVILGGNGTHKTANLLSEHGIPVVTLPKTIDNDLWGTQVTFGFQSAMNIAVEVIDSIHSTAFSHSRVFIVEIMGHKAGWLTLHAGIASGADVIVIPEIPYDARAIAAAIQQRAREGKRFSIVAVAEGGIIVNGRRLKSFVFTTDLAIIRNCDADAVFAVYPFTPQQAISDAIIKYSYVPVFCGVGGGTTRGLRTVQLARDVESQGAMGVVLNAPINNLNLRAVSGVIDIPTVITVTKFGTDFEARIEAGASILNIAAAAQTPELVREARKALPDVPIIATGGKTGESILRTIEAGANAITYTPPSTYELFQEMMKGYRE